MFVAEIPLVTRMGRTHILHSRIPAGSLVRSARNYIVRGEENAAGQLSANRFDRDLMAFRKVWHGTLVTVPCPLG
jgi:hypothetical protein